jgi:hypothetical protein
VWRAGATSAACPLDFFASYDSRTRDLLPGGEPASSLCGETCLAHRMRVSRRTIDRRSADRISEKNERKAETKNHQFGIHSSFPLIPNIFFKKKL